jgi:hypothetical protein
LLRWGLTNSLLRLVLNHDPLDFCLLSSWDYKHASLHPQTDIFISQVAFSWIYLFSFIPTLLKYLILFPLSNPLDFGLCLQSTFHASHQSQFPKQKHTTSLLYFKQTVAFPLFL